MYRKLSRRSEPIEKSDRKPHRGRDKSYLALAFSFDWKASFRVQQVKIQPKGGRAEQ
jgi:hypothetical protein